MYEFKVIENKGWYFIYIGLSGAPEEEFVYLGYSAYADRLMDNGIFMTHDSLERATEHLLKAEEWFKWRREIKKVFIPDIHK